MFFIDLKRIMTVITETTKTETDLSTGVETVTTTTDTSTTIVEPDTAGFTLIEGLKPGVKVKIVIKIQNISAENGEKITVHFNFVPLDCDGHFYIDEIVSTGDITAIGRSRN